MRYSIPIFCSAAHLLGDQQQLRTELHHRLADWSVSGHGARRYAGSTSHRRGYYGLSALHQPWQSSSPVVLGAAVLYISVTAHTSLAGLVVAGLGRCYHMAFFAALGTLDRRSAVATFYANPRLSASRITPAAYMSALQPVQKYRPFVRRLLVVAGWITQLAAILAIQVFRLQVEHHRQSSGNAIVLRQGHPIAYAQADHPRIADLLAKATIVTHLNIVTAPEFNL